MMNDRRDGVAQVGHLFPGCHRCIFNESAPLTPRRSRSAPGGRPDPNFSRQASRLCKPTLTLASGGSVNRLLPLWPPRPSLLLLIIAPTSWLSAGGEESPWAPPFSQRCRDRQVLEFRRPLSDLVVSFCSCSIFKLYTWEVKIFYVTKI